MANCSQPSLIDSKVGLDSSVVKREILGKHVKNSNLLKAKDLFHVKLRQALDEKGWKAPDLARAMPGVGRQMVSRWLKGRIPNGIYMSWLLMLFDLRPEDLVGSLPASEGSKLSKDRGQKAPLDLPEASDARRLLEALEELMGDFRRHLANQAAAGMEGAAELDAAAKKDAG